MRNQLLGNRYRILDLIGEGGMAYVYVAVDEKLGRKVAIKVLHEHMERNPDIRKRFQLEAQAVSSLEHPNIVKVYDFSGDRSERLWIVTEVIRGKNLAQYVQQFPGGWLHPIVAACIVREICKALDKAHSHGIVHRDIKPENVMVTLEGRVKLMDFGIAKDLGRSGMTVTGTFMGSPSYMSPEQIRGRGVDLRSDLYSLSVLFYEVVTGRLPYTGQTTHDVVMKIMEGEFTHPCYIVPSLPDRLNEMIVRGMAKEPALRHQTAREYAQEIDQLLSFLGFDESHVELERYFKDRVAYEQRLAKTRTALIKSSTLALKMRRTGAQPSHSLASSRRSRTQRPTVPPLPDAPRHPTFRNEETWQNHLPANAAPRAPSQVALPPPAPGARRTNLAVPPPPAAAMRDGRRTQHIAPAREGAAQAPYAHPHAQVVRRPLPRRRRSVRRVAPPRVTAARPSPFSYIFGVLLVGLICGVSMWGFWELAGRLGKASNSVAHVHTSSPHAPPSATAKASHRRPRRNGTPVTVKVVTRPATDHETLPLPHRPAHTTHTRATLAEKRHNPASRHPAPTNITPVTFVREEPARVSDSDPNLTIQAAELRRPKKVAPSAAPETATGGDKATSSTHEPKETPAGKGKLLVSSQPAAEIFIDGRRVGTTVDNTSDSGWMTLAAGRHAVELRRQGYTPFRTRLALDADEKKTLPRVVLEPSGSKNSGKGSLTLRVSAYPAQVTIHNIDNNTTQAFTMRSNTKVLQLAQGRYAVKIEHGEESKQRDLVLTGAQGQLTFTADFKEDD